MTEYGDWKTAFNELSRRITATNARINELYKEVHGLDEEPEHMTFSETGPAAKSVRYEMRQMWDAVNDLKIWCDEHGNLEQHLEPGV